VPEVLESLWGGKSLRAEQDFVFPVVQIVVRAVRGVFKKIGHDKELAVPA
jgi:hypothetical protein